MAQECSIPCNAGALQFALQQRLSGDELYQRLPAIGAALLAAFGAPFALLWGGPLPALVLLGWCVVGFGITLGQSWLAASVPARQALPAELMRLVAVNAPRIHESRLPALLSRAQTLSLDRPNFDTLAGQVLQDLREATGEAWRCPCRKRGLPIPLPMRRARQRPVI